MPDNKRHISMSIKDLGFNVQNSKAVWADSDDHVGAYADILQKVTSAEVNLHASDAFEIGGKFATVLFAEDHLALCKALGLKSIVTR